VKLPDNLKEILSKIEGPTVLTVGINDLPAFIVRDKRRELRTIKGANVPILFQPQLGLYETGAIFRMYIEVHDKKDSPYRGESFLNPDNSNDLDLLHFFGKSNVVSYFFVDEQNLVIGAKQIRVNEQTRLDLVGMIVQAIEHNQSLPAIDYTQSRNRMLLETTI